MKKIILLTLLALMTLCSAEELKITTLEVTKIDYKNGQLTGSIFRIVCINEYKWLQRDGEHGSISQMFQNDRMNGYAKAIPCKN